MCHGERRTLDAFRDSTRRHSRSGGGGGAGEQDALARACANAMSLAREFGLRSVAFPLLGTESGYPEDLALRTEKAVLNVALVNDNMKIILVLAPDVGEA